MVIDLASHNLRGRGRSRFGASLADTVLDYAKGAAGEIASDRGVKARVVVESVKAITGVAPLVDTSDPAVTWVRMQPSHAKWAESMLLKAVKAGPDKRPADVKIDVMPAVSPLLLKRILPMLLIAGAGVFAVGYYFGRD